MTASIVLVALLAQTSADPTLGKEAFELGMARFEIGAFEEALDDFVRAYELTHHHEILFNIAQCHRNLEQLRRAIFFFERYLEHPDAEDPESVRLVVDELESALVKRKLALPPPALAPPPVVATRAHSPTPIVRTWWFWTIVAGSVAAITAGVVAGVAVSGRGAPDDRFATFDYREL